MKDFRLRIFYLFYLAVLINPSGGQIVSYDPRCEWNKALDCGIAAVNKAKVNKCNWQEIMPGLQSCINNATLGCYAHVQADWEIWMNQFNTTLQNPDCEADCVNQTLKDQTIANCKLRYTGLNNLTTEILSASPNSNITTKCSQLNDIYSCCTQAASGCPILMKEVGQLFTTGQISQAINGQCKRNITYVPIITTTALPLGITATDRVITNGSQAFRWEYIIIIVVAIVFLLVINMIVIYIFCRYKGSKKSKTYNSTLDDSFSVPSSTMERSSPETFYRAPSDYYHTRSERYERQPEPMSSAPYGYNTGLYY